MARSTRGTVPAVLAREKSCNWLRGAIRKRFPECSADEREAVVERLRGGRARTLSDILEATPPVALRNRKPTEFLEPVMWPCWAPRVEQLAGLVNGAPVTTAELFARAHAQLGWTDNNVKQTLAAAEGDQLHFHRSLARWSREPPEDHGAAGTFPGARTASESAYPPSRGPEAIRVRISEAPLPLPFIPDGTRTPSLRAETGEGTAVRVSGAAPKPQRNHPWRPRMSTTPTSTANHEQPNEKPNGASANGANGSAKNGVGASGSAAADVNRRRSETLKRKNAEKRTAKAEPATALELEAALEVALEAALRPVAKKVLGRVIGRLVTEVIGG